MKKRDRKRHKPPTESELPSEGDVEELVAFYERTGAMAVHTIGPPLDRPIVPSRRPERVGDFHFTPRTAAQAATASRTTDEDPEEREIRQDFLQLLDEHLHPR